MPAQPAGTGTSAGAAAVSASDMSAACGAAGWCQGCLSCSCPPPMDPESHRETETARERERGTDRQTVELSL